MTTAKFLLTSAMILLASAAGIAQVSSDSISSLKQQKQSLELSARINERKIQLAKLENTLDKKTHEAESATAAARRAADDNAEAASKLAGDSQDKSLARKAEKAGDAAKKSAKHARIAADNLAELKKDIESLKGKISDDEAKLATNPLVVPAQ